MSQDDPDSIFNLMIAVSSLNSRVASRHVRPPIFEIFDMTASFNLWVSEAKDFHKLFLQGLWIIVLTIVKKDDV